MDFQDILYSKSGGVARITINRPHRLNALNPITMREMSAALHDAGGDPSIGVIVLTGAGDRAFCSGGDVQREADQGTYRPMSLGDEPYASIWFCSKPVIARVNGYAIGGGQVLQLVCDLSIASETARFGQNGPRIGSFSPGWGTSYLVRAIGEKKARELWFLCRQYTAREALAMGLINAVVPPDKLDEEVDKWCQEILALAPTAIQALKEQFQLESAHCIAIARAGSRTVRYVVASDEAKEGQKAFVEKRKADFSAFRK